MAETDRHEESRTTELVRLITRKGAPGETRIARAELRLAPEPGEIILAPDVVSLTTNNITYAAFGDALGYWQFFPAGEAGWGHMPAWGFADVVASRVPGAEVGERYFGFFPIASHVRMRPERAGERGFIDGAAHRKSLPAVYNQYARCNADAYYRPQYEPLQCLLKPLFLTSFLLADFLVDNGFFGARRLVFSSASSKTAYGTAACLEGAVDVRLVALTSPRNLDFVKRLGCYHEAGTYEQFAGLPVDLPTMYVDFSGDPALRDRVHRHFGASLVYSCSVGAAQSTEAAPLTAAVGPAPQFFFAPDQVRKRSTDWGQAELNRRIGEGLLRFYDRVSATPDPWLTLVTGKGYEAARDVIGRLGRGQLPPAEGHVVRLR
jgi:hypothetical protein